jgi:hypothetical protein
MSNDTPYHGWRSKSFLVCPMLLFFVLKPSSIVAAEDPISSSSIVHLLLYNTCRRPILLRLIRVLSPTVLYTSRSTVCLFTPGFAGTEASVLPTWSSTCSVYPALQTHVICRQKDPAIFAFSLLAAEQQDLIHGSIRQNHLNIPKPVSIR